MTEPTARLTFLGETLGLLRGAGEVGGLRAREPLAVAPCECVQR